MKFRESDLVRSISKESFFEFLKEFWDIIVPEDPQFNWHVEYLCDELQEVAERVFAGWPREYDLIINIPPGMTKSTIVSQAYPAWCWTRMPEARFLCASYAAQVAMKDSLKTRDLVQSDKYQECYPEIQLREDENMKGLFTNTFMGSRFSTGVGGILTGYHGNFLLVDDPLNPEESYSEAELKSVNRWMRTTLPSRRTPKDVAPLILVQQRLHMMDPSGEMLERAAGKVKWVCLPGKLSEDPTKENVRPPELVARYTDGLLDPNRLGPETLATMEKELGAYAFAAQILQSPMPLGGGMFEVEKIVQADACPQMVRQVRSWDKAGTEGSGAWSVGLLMGLDAQGRFWILDVVRGQWGSAKRETMIEQTTDNDGEKVDVVLEIEGGSGGKESGESTVRNLAGTRVHTYHPTGDKESRAYPLSSQVGGGNVYCLKRPWTKDLIEEFRFFPASRFKDQVDAASGAFNWIAKRKRKVGALW